MFPTPIGTPTPKVTVTWNHTCKRTGVVTRKSKTFSDLYASRRWYTKQFNAGNDPHIEKAVS